MIAEDLLLLLMDDETGAPAGDTTSLDYGLAGAVLIDLALLGRIRVDGDPKPKRRFVEVVGAGPTGDDALDAALTVIAEKPRRAEALVPKVSKHLRALLLTRLVGRGLLREENSKVLGLFPRHRWPAVDSAHENEVREHLRHVLVDGAEPGQDTAALVALLSAIDHAHRVIPGLDRRTQSAVKARAKEIAEGTWAADAVRAAVKAVQDATTAAMLAAVIAATAGSSAATS